MVTWWSRDVVLWAARLFAVLGAACLTWTLVVWRHAAVVQTQAKVQIAKVEALRRGPEDARGRVGLGPGGPETSLIGVLDIPRLNLSVAVLEGDDDRTLDVAAGHLPDTPLPWHPGNAALAGHRDTFFRPLQHVRAGDRIRLSTRHGELTYRVRRIVIVDPRDLSVLEPADGVDLTLITCHPFNHLGAAPNRFVIQAERTATTSTGTALATARSVR